MTKQIFSFVLLCVIALQSLGTAVAAQSSHQVDSQHLQTEHSHDQDTRSSALQSDGDSHDISDCHHCGHCSGSHLTWLASHLSELNIAANGAQPWHLLAPPEQQRAEPNYRPPIA